MFTNKITNRIEQYKRPSTKEVTAVQKRDDQNSGDKQKHALNPVFGVSPDIHRLDTRNVFYRKNKNEMQRNELSTSIIQQEKRAKVDSVDSMDSVAIQTINTTLSQKLHTTCVDTRRKRMCSEMLGITAGNGRGCKRDCSTIDQPPLQKSNTQNQNPFLSTCPVAVTTPAAVVGPTSPTLTFQPTTMASDLSDMHLTSWGAHNNTSDAAHTLVHMEKRKKRKKSKKSKKRHHHDKNTVQKKRLILVPPDDADHHETEPLGNRNHSERRMHCLPLVGLEALVTRMNAYISELSTFTAKPAILLVGPPGSGKSAFVEAYARSAGIESVTTFDCADDTRTATGISDMVQLTIPSFRVAKKMTVRTEQKERLPPLNFRGIRVPEAVQRLIQRCNFSMIVGECIEGLHTQGHESGISALSNALKERKEEINNIRKLDLVPPNLLSPEQQRQHELRLKRGVTPESIAAKLGKSVKKTLKVIRNNDGVVSVSSPLVLTCNNLSTVLNRRIVPHCIVVHMPKHTFQSAVQLVHTILHDLLGATEQEEASCFDLVHDVGTKVASLVRPCHMIAASLFLANVNVLLCKNGLEHVFEQQKANKLQSQSQSQCTKLHCWETLLLKKQRNVCDNTSNRIYIDVRALIQDLEMMVRFHSCGVSSSPSSCLSSRGLNLDLNTVRRYMATHHSVSSRDQQSKSAAEIVMEMYSNTVAKTLVPRTTRIAPHTQCEVDLEALTAFSATNMMDIVWQHFPILATGSNIPRILEQICCNNVDVDNDSDSVVDANTNTNTKTMLLTGEGKGRQEKTQSGQYVDCRQLQLLSEAMDVLSDCDEIRGACDYNADVFFDSHIDNTLVPYLATRGVVVSVASGILKEAEKSTTKMNCSNNNNAVMTPKVGGVVNTLPPMAMGTGREVIVRHRPYCMTIESNRRKQMDVRSSLWQEDKDKRSLKQSSNKNKNKHNYTLVTAIQPWEMDGYAKLLPTIGVTLANKGMKLSNRFL